MKGTFHIQYQRSESEVRSIIRLSELFEIRIIFALTRLLKDSIRRPTERKIQNGERLNKTSFQVSNSILLLFSRSLVLKCEIFVTAQHFKNFNDLCIKVLEKVLSCSPGLVPSIRSNFRNMIFRQTVKKRTLLYRQEICVGRTSSKLKNLKFFLHKAVFLTCC